MSTLTLRPAFSMHRASGSRRGVREQDVRQAMLPRPERTIAVTIGAIAVALFSILAPMAGDPTERLSALEATSTIPTDETIAYERPFEMPPTAMGPAITWEALLLAEEGALQMPPLEVRVTPQGEEIVQPPEG
jgi:hypothetical protein